MPTGRPLKYEKFVYEAIKSPLHLVPPDGAHRVYLHSEVAYIRYRFTDDERELLSGEGFPLLPDYPDEFDTDLHRLWVVAGTSDSALSVYWYGT
jgi:hypothetical protein